MSPVPDVAFGIPAWGGAAFIGETIQSALDQTGVSVAIAVSIDGDGEDIAKACQPFAADPRVRILREGERLGAARNYYAALSAAAETGAKFIALLPDDDALEPAYAVTLRAALRRSPSAALAFSRIARFGDGTGRISQRPVTGSALGRQISLLLDHFKAVAFRGLTRTVSFRAVKPLESNAVDDFGIDTLWMARIALVGDLIEVDEELYRKRMRPDSTLSTWSSWSFPQKSKAWAMHCAEMMLQALEIARNPTARDLVIRAAVARLSGRGGMAVGFESALMASEAERVATAFRAALPPELAEEVEGPLRAAI